MSDLPYKPLKPQDHKYLCDCPFRRPFPNSATVMACGLIEDATGMVQPVNPMTCAQCRLDDGGPSPAHIRAMARGHLLGQLQLVLFGFFSDTERIKGLFKRAWEVLAEDIPSRKAIADMLEKCIKKGRLSQDEALALIKDHIPGLGEVDL
jgi:hypothetical protein